MIVSIYLNGQQSK